MALNKRLTSMIIISGLLASCSSEKAVKARHNTATPLGEDYPAEWSEEQVNAYEQCLQDSMAQATAWAVIEQQCKEAVNGDGLELLELYTH